jgi:hypothetical protein
MTDAREAAHRRMGEEVRRQDAVQAGAAVAAGGVMRIPVQVVDCDRHPGGKSPLLVVGTLFTGGHAYRDDDADRAKLTHGGDLVRSCPCVPNKYSPTMNEYLLGNLRPRPATDEEDTYFFLTSPPLNNGWEFFVDGLEREGDTFTVRVSYLLDNRQAGWGPGPNHSGQMVRVGKLKPGTYTARVVFREFIRDERATPAARPGVYTLRETREGVTPFTVNKGDPWHTHTWDEPLSAAVVRMEQTVAVPVVGGGGSLRVQEPVYSARRIGLKKGEVPAANAGGVTFTAAPSEENGKDFTDWGIKAAPYFAETPPGPDEAGTLVARFGFTGKPLGRWDWAEIGEVRWASDEVVVIRGTVWRRPYIVGNDDHPAAAEFAVPLASRGLGPLDALAKRLKVTVEWREGVYNPSDAVFEVRR